MVYPLETNYQPLANVIYEGESIGIHPNSIDLCASGVQFNSTKPVSEYKILEMQLKLPPEPYCPCKETITCSGVVVDCCKNADCGHYHVSLFFLDMPETGQGHLGH